MQAGFFFCDGEEYQDVSSSKGVEITAWFDSIIYNGIASARK